MKIINKKQFLDLPEGVLYSEYKPCYFTGLFRKLETLNDILGKPNDFLYINLIAEIDEGSEEYFDVLFKAQETQEHIKLDFECVSRDGMYDDEQMYAVYSSDDILNLSKAIANCIGV